MWRSRFLFLCLSILPCGLGTSSAFARTELGCGQVYLTAGKSALGQNNLEEAERFLGEARICNPEDSNVYALLGIVYLLRNDPDTAKKIFKEATEKRPRTFLAYPRARDSNRILAGWIADKKVEPKAVRETFKGFLEFRRTEYENARNVLKNAVGLDARYGDAHYWLGLSHLRLNGLEEAHLSFQQALDDKVLPPLLVEIEGLKKLVEDLWNAIEATRRGDHEQASFFSRRARSRSLELVHAYDQWQGLNPPRPTLAVVQTTAQTSGSVGESRSVPEPPVEGVFVAAFDSRPDYLTMRQEPVWDWRLSLNGGNDSNPLGVPDGGIALTPDGDVAGPRSDTVFNLDLRGEYHPFYDRAGWSLGVTFEGDQATFADFDFFDLTRLSATVHLAWGGDPLGFLVGPLGYTRVPLANRRFAAVFQGGATYSVADGESFERVGRLGLGLAVRESAATSTQIDFDFVDREAFDVGGAALLPDSEEWTFKIHQFVYLGRRDRYVRFGAGSGDRDAGAVFDASHLEASIELALPFADRWALQLAVSRREVDFGELESNPLFPNFLADQPREDSTVRAVAALIWRWTDRLRLVARGGVIDQDVDLGSASTLVDLSFERRVGSIGLTWFF